ncbi:MAG: pilus assembly protein N-terminal domain-containing protein [Selenomonadaceae bacterium]|nr:pilus assembly protein N-terminal domain-containing protein [Selenomonadaceae bacterium]
MYYSALRKCCLLATVPICLSVSVAHAAEMETLSIKKQTSHYMDMGKQIQRVAVGNKDIASVIQLPGSASEFLIVTKANAGSTALFVWTIDGVRHEYLIVVSPEDPGQAMMIEKAIGLPDVHVKMVGERILLTGTVENQYEKNYALQTARLFINGSTDSSLLVGSGFDMELDIQSATSGGGGSGEVSESEAKGTIIDLLQILHPTQIRLEAQIIEINSDDAKSLGIRYGEDPANSPGIFTFGEAHDRTVTEESYTYIDDEGQTQVATYSYGSHVRPFHNNPMKWISQRFGAINAQINLLVTNGKAKILSRPSVTTLSGEQATIQIGGRIPYEISTMSTAGLQIIDYGIILQFKPVVDAQKRINSAIHAEVSNIGGQTSDGRLTILTRSANSVISLSSGSPIVIGGLMDSSESKTVSKIPLLGDIPIIGEFFKHTSKSRDKRELIIVVTPYLVESEDLSQSPMSEPMRQWYEQDKVQREALEPHDFKEPEENILEIKEPEPERILPPPNYPTNDKTTDRPFNK